jgi:molybdenum cofactor cytidylyltransferase
LNPRYHINQCGIVILAAGQSKRLGQPKQLLPFGGTALVVRVADAACRIKLYPVLVVLGAHAEKIQPYLNMPGLKVVVNEEWEEGMASSIRKGLAAMDQFYPHLDGIMFLVCDQPHLDHQLIRDLIQLQDETGKPVAACNYAGKLGTPALFHKTLFQELMQLKGDAGARKLLEEMKDDVAMINFEQGSIDIDTLEDYENLINPKNGAA